MCKRTATVLDHDDDAGGIENDINIVDVDGNEEDRVLEYIVHRIVESSVMYCW